METNFIFIRDFSGTIHHVNPKYISRIEELNDGSGIMIWVKDIGLKTNISYQQFLVLLKS